MIQERDGSLVLLQGTPRRWLEQGHQIRITEAPTFYGPLSLDCVSNVKEDTLRLRLKVPPRLGSVPIRLKLRLPEGKRVGEVMLNGQPHRDIDGEWIILHGLQDQVEITARTVAAKGV